MERIEGGNTRWARKTTMSEIFVSKPAEWFKIWFYIVSEVNWKPNGKFDRGSGFFHNEEISLATHSTLDQVKRALAYMRSASMISTDRSTRGFHLKVLNYAKYQEDKNYGRTDERTARAPEKHQRNTTILEEGNKERITDDGFNEFWELYPRKEAKKKAQEVWKKLQPSLSVRVRIGEAISAALTSPQWTKDDGRFIPHPATWLNQERWEDEETKKAEPRQIGAEHNQRLKELGYES